MIKNPHWDFENARMRGLAFFFMQKKNSKNSKVRIANFLMHNA